MVPPNYLTNKQTNFRTSEEKREKRLRALDRGRGRLEDRESRGFQAPVSGKVILPPNNECVLCSDQREEGSRTCAAHRGMVSSEQGQA